MLRHGEILNEEKGRVPYQELFDGSSNTIHNYDRYPNEFDRFKLAYI
jgi:hypothetical protein